jgi:hypothetical protein
MGIIRASMNGSGAFYTVKCDPTVPEVRDSVLAAICRKRKGIDRKKAEEALEEIAAQSLGGDDVEQEKLTPASTSPSSPRAELFHCGETAYATIDVSDGKARRIRRRTPSARCSSSAGWRRASIKRSAGCDKAPRSTTRRRAQRQGDLPRPEKKVAVRVAEHGGNVYLDLADESWRVVRITARGWTIITDPPIKFLRRKGMLALPTPARTGASTRSGRCSTSRRIAIRADGRLAARRVAPDAARTRALRSTASTAAPSRPRRRCSAC